MKNNLFIAIVVTISLLSTDLLSAQIPLHPPVTQVTEPLGPPNTRAGYYIKDGETHHAWILTRKAEENIGGFVVPPQPGYPETLILTPEQISEWGIRDDKTIYLGVCVETESGPEWYFMERLSFKPDDGSRIAYLSDKVLPVATYFRVVDGKGVETGTERNAAPMLDYFASSTGYRSSDSDLEYPERIRHSSLDRYYAAFTERNDKLFPQRRFGVTVGAGPATTYFGAIQNVAMGRQFIEPDIGFSLSLGTFMRIPIDGAFSFQPELLYSYVSVGGTMEYRDLDFDKTRFVTNSIRLPLLLRFNRIRSNSDWMPYVELGPAIDLNFGSLSLDKIEVGPDNGQFIVGEREKNSLSTFSYGFVLGAGAEYYISAKQAAWFGVRYSRISNIPLGKYPMYNLHRIELVAAFSLFNF